MNKNERSCIMRIMSDMIKADGIIDSREMDSLSSMMAKYNVKSDDKTDSESITLSDAVRTLKSKSSSLSHDMLGDVTNLAMSDKFCAREEALLLIALTYSFSDDTQADIISITSPEVFLPNGQILYVESSFNEDVNSTISSHYVEIAAESRLAGFDFVYIPQIIKHYQQLNDSQLCQMISFLYPQASKERLTLAIQQLKGFTTALFCKNLLSSKLKINEIDDTPPAIMVKIGSSICNHQLYFNYLLLEISDNVMETIMNFLRTFNTFYQTRVLDYLQEQKGRFIFRGFYRQLLELIMLQKGVRSNVLIDTDKGEIYFPEADVKIEKLHRREKALYALFLVESPSGGINFAKPETARQFGRYERRMEAIQAKYNLIYEKFGGERNKAPRLDVAETRLPMISLIKRQISKLGDVLYHVDDYIIQRNLYGNYGVRISAGQCFCKDFGSKEAKPIEESESWQKILAL